MTETPSLKDLTLEWLDTLPGRKTGPKFEVLVVQYQEFINHLKKYNYTKETFTNSTIDSIVRTCVWGQRMKPSTKKEMEETRKNAFEIALIRCFPAPIPIEPLTEEELKKRDIVRPEIHIEEEPEKEYKRIGKDMPESAILKLTKPTLVVDKEFSKLLGFDDE